MQLEPLKKRDTAFLGESDEALTNSEQEIFLANSNEALLQQEQAAFLNKNHQIFLVANDNFANQNLKQNFVEINFRNFEQKI